MTYSSSTAVYSNIPVPFQSNYKLYRYHTKTTEQLNDNPVLFIPGSFGAYDQVRSLASTLSHNKKQIFQYFTVDFNQTMSGLHASIILSQAAFVNEGIHAIFKLYAEAEGVAMPKKIILIGHSIGGVVARTALMMSNHPRCVVSTLVLLSAPTLAPPFPLDASLTALYTKINQAWMQAYTNDSKACRDSARQHPLYIYPEASPEASSEPPNPNGKFLSMQWACPVCTARVRVLAVTGGVIDELVHPTTTSLSSLGPLPYNLTVSDAKRAAKQGAMFSPIYAIAAVIRRIAFTIHSYFHPPPASSSSVSPETASPVSIMEETNATCTPEPPLPSQHPWESITRAQWEEHMRPFIIPQLLHIHTTQIKQVGFVVDHRAMLWCSQLLSALTSALEKITAAEQQGLSIDLLKTLPLKRGHKANMSSAALPEVQYLIQRNHTVASASTRIAADVDYIQSATKSTLLTASILFATAHWTLILSVYMALGCLSIAYSLLTSLSAKSSAEWTSPWNTLAPQKHLLWMVIYPPVGNSLASALGYKHFMQLAHGAAGLLVVPLAIAGYHCATEEPSTLLARYSTGLFLLVAYGCALSLRITALLSLATLRFLSNALVTALYTLLRWTVWCRPIRRALKKPLKPASRVLAATWSLLNKYAFVLTFLSILATLELLGDNSSSSTFSLLLSVYLLSIYSLSLAAYASILLAPPSSANQQASARDTEILLLFWPIFMTTAVPVLFTLRQCFGWDRVSANGLHIESIVQAVGGYRAECCVILTFLRAYLLTPAEDDHIVAIPLLTRLFGVHHATELENKRKQYKSQQAVPGAASRTSPRSVCVHEQGGRYAVYKLLETQEGGSIQLPVDIARVRYIVSSCACFQDKNMKHEAEYCEFCQCRNCGSKYVHDQHATALWTELVDGVATMNADVFLFAFLVLVAGWNVFYIGDKLYSYTYMLGSVATAFVVRSAGWKLGIFK